MLFAVNEHAWYNDGKTTERKRVGMKGIRIGLFMAALACLAAGIGRGEMTAVWQKAATVCLECIGLG